MKTSTYPSAHSAGFTIVETIMVLAIAGLILLLALLSLPALERNSRNGQRRQDASNALQAISRYELNNSGTLPTVLQLQPYYTANYYSAPGAITITSSTSGNALILTNNNVDTLKIANYHLCQPDHTAKSSGAGYHDVAAVYGIETAGGSSPECKQL